jgi:predicted HicB family RNase H-like nuclease
MIEDVAQLNMPLDDDLHQRLRVAAAQRGVKQHEFVTEAIRQAVEEHEAAEEKRRRGR